MKQIFLYSLAMFIISCNSFTNNKVEKAIDTVKTITTLDSSMFTKKQSFFDYFLDKYADSINRVTKAEDLPFFLQNPQFDYENAGIFSGFHTPISLRHLILKRVSNCGALKYIINNPTGTYNKKPVLENGITADAIDSSNLQFALEQYKVLGCSIKSPGSR